MLPSSGEATSNSPSGGGLRGSPPLVARSGAEFTAVTYVHLDDDDLPEGDVRADLLEGTTAA